MKHGSLFNGIGGFQLSAHWMGWQNVFHCEIDKFCNQVVKRHFPESICYEDIKQTDFTKWRGAIDILTGGFPCQPYSSAGKRKGTADDRHLWPEMLRAVGEIRPRWVVGENVPGLVNWGNGVVFEQIHVDMEAKGYQVFPVILPACGKEAPHERSRVWIVAYACSDGYEQRGLEQNRRAALTWEGEKGIASYPYSQGLQKWIQPGERRVRKEETTQPGRQPSRGYTASDWSQFPTVSPIRGGNDGVSFELDFIKRIKNDKIIGQKSITEIDRIIWQAMRTMWEYREFAEAPQHIYANRLYDSMPEMSCERSYEGWNLGKGINENEGLRDLWESFYSKPYEEAQDLQQRLFECIGEIERRKKMGQKNRADRIKALGNAIVPKIAFEIFKAIEAYDNF